jgi:hypothetical protein
MIVGGDYRKSNDSVATAAITSDGGKTWTLIDRPFSYRSCVAWAKDRWVAVGTSGSNFSQDNGVTWKPLDLKNYNSVGFASSGAGCAVGPSGWIAKFADYKIGHAATPFWRRRTAHGGQLQYRYRGSSPCSLDWD